MIESPPGEGRETFDDQQIVLCTSHQLAPFPKAAWFPSEGEQSDPGGQGQGGGSWGRLERGQDGTGSLYV